MSSFEVSGGSYTTSSTAEASDVPERIGDMGRLEAAVHHLHDRIEALQAQLLPVTGPPSPEAAMLRDEPGSPLLNVILRLEEEIANLAALSRRITL